MWFGDLHLLAVFALVLVTVGPRWTVTTPGPGSAGFTSAASPILPNDSAEPGHPASESKADPFPALDLARPVCTSSFVAGDGPRVLRQEKGLVADEFVALFLSSDHLEEFQASVEKRHDHQFSFQPQEAYAMSYGELVGAYIPIRGGAGHSFYTVWFDRASCRVVETAAALFRLDNNANIQVAIESGSGLVMEAVFTPEGHVLNGAIHVDGRSMPLTSLKTTSPSGFWDCFLECLGGDPQVPPWLRVSVDITCGVACLISKPSCLICAIIRGGIVVVPCITQCGEAAHLLYLPMTTKASRQ